jgi:hypothetical protein
VNTAHNHPPRCCCIQLHDSQRLSTDLCPLCPEHGELAQLSNGECPNCHQLPGRPHTEFCQLGAPLSGIEVRNPGDRTTLAPGQTSQPATHTRTTPLATPTPAGACPSCHLDYDWPPTQACTQPDTHDHPR